MNNQIKNPYGTVKVEWDTMMGHWAVWCGATFDDSESAHKLAKKLKKAFKKIK